MRNGRDGKDNNHHSLDLESNYGRFAVFALAVPFEERIFATGDEYFVGGHSGDFHGQEKGYYVVMSDARGKYSVRYFLSVVSSANKHDGIIEFVFLFELKIGL